MPAYEPLTLLLILVLLAAAYISLSVVQWSICLWVASKILKLKINNYKTAFKTTIIYLIPSLILSVPLMWLVTNRNIDSASLLLLLGICITIIILHIYLIRRFYHIDWKMALLSYILMFLVSFVIGLIIWVILLIPLLLLLSVGSLGRNI
jgi:hypothetical protein